MKTKNIFDGLKLYEIDYNRAKELFLKDIVIYIQSEDLMFAPECFNTISLSRNTWDGSMNIYTKNLTPIQYGFDKIINWINERRNNFDKIKYFTYNSKEFLLID